MIKDLGQNPKTEEKFHSILEKFLHILSLLHFPKLRGNNNAMLNKSVMKDETVTLLKRRLISSGLHVFGFAPHQPGRSPSRKRPFLRK